MSRNNGRGVSITPRKLNQLVKSYLYRKRLAETLESLQLEILVAIQESECGVVFAQGFSITADPETGEINLKALPKTDSRQLRMKFIGSDSFTSQQHPHH